MICLAVRVFKTLYKCLSWAAIVLVFWHLFCLSPGFDKMPKALQSQLKLGTALMIPWDQEYFSPFNQVAVVDPYVYVLYDKLHLVKVYNTDGNYVCTYAFKKEAENVPFASLHIRGDKLYVFSGSTFVYVFTNNVCVQVYQDEEGLAVRREIRDGTTHPNNTDKEENRYFIKCERVCREDLNGNQSVFVERPAWYALSRSVYFVPLFLFFLIPRVVKVEMDKHKQKKQAGR